MARIHITTLVTLTLIGLVLYIVLFHVPKPSSDERELPDELKDVHIEDLSKNLARNGLQVDINPPPFSKFSRNDTFSPPISKPKNGSGTVNILICSDGTTLGGMVAAMNSIYLNSQAHIKFYLVVDSESLEHVSKWISESSLKAVDYSVKVFNESWVKDKLILKDSRKDVGSPLNYARLYFPRIFPNIKGRVIFIDSDTVIQGDIAELNATKLDPGHAVAFSDDCSAVSSRYGIVMNKYASYINFQNEKVKGLGLNPMECSFNGGVFIADVTEWRKQLVTEKLDYWVTLNSKEDIYGSQRGGGHSGPPMMVVFYKKYSKIPPEWHIRHLGVTSGTRYSEAFVRSAKLLHWNGRFKPWGHNSQHTLVWEKYYVPDPTGEFKIARKYGNV